MYKFALNILCVCHLGQICLINDGQIAPVAELLGEGLILLGEGAGTVENRKDDACLLGTAAGNVDALLLDGIGGGADAGGIGDMTFEIP